ncbi:Thymic stromal cotransporter [Micractinium conductrix]|uniref:Thymic stromal cotransporter n=1 Tax=Micractinium conductrix TaxID=554055 RepID=A0A2P6VR37_9CHLO|nr:Thymic stromal cotransporter [Micractinium conductrix]|eukprot:PSC76566.1 Thymic stromal cotransporter [Micractinium conductrix]
MLLKLTPGLNRLLEEAAADQTLSQDLRAAAGAGAAAGASQWDTVKAAADAARARGDVVPTMQELCRGGGLAFPDRPKPVGKPPELQKRLDEARAKLEQQQYDRMVRDVTQHERAAAAAREGGLSSYRQQMSFGVHVLAMMAAFYAFGHAAGMGITSNKTAHPFVGLLFMVCALVLETTLYIIRTTVPPTLHQAAARQAVTARIARQQERLQREQASSGGSGNGGREVPAHGGGGGGGRPLHVAANPASAPDGAAKPAEDKKAD